MASQNLKIKSTAGLLEVVRHMENLIASFKEGTICVRKDDESIILKPQEPVSLELEAEVKFDKETLREKLTIELKWKKKETAAEDTIFSISHEIPQQEQES